MNMSEQVFVEDAESSGHRQRSRIADTSTIQPLYLRLKKHLEKRVRRL